jgi:hypothetical protein
MSPLVPNLSSGAKLVFSAFYDCQDPAFLVPDLLLVQLAGGTCINVSWFPEFEPSGAYYVNVFCGHEEIRKVDTKNATEAIRIVERLATEFSQQIAKLGAPGLQVGGPSRDPFVLPTNIKLGACTGGGTPTVIDRGGVSLQACSSGKTVEFIYAA